MTREAICLEVRFQSVWQYSRKIYFWIKNCQTQCLWNINETSRWEAILPANFETSIKLRYNNNILFLWSEFFFKLLNNVLRHWAILNMKVFGFVIKPSWEVALNTTTTTWNTGETLPLLSFENVNMDFKSLQRTKSLIKNWSMRNLTTNKIIVFVALLF